MKFAAVGSAGFLGRHAANAVHAAGHECAVLDVIDIPATLRAAGLRWQAESPESVDDLWRASSSADVEKFYSAVENPPLGAELNGLAEIVVAECPAPLSFGVPRPGDISPAGMSAAKARNLLGWLAGVSFAEGLRDLFVHHCAAAQ
jgi:Nucleoside-diphosphate-sugar epimerases